MWCRVGLFSIKTTFLQQQQKNVYSACIRISRDRHCHWPLQRASQREVLFTLVTVPSLKFHFGFSNIRARYYAKLPKRHGVHLLFYPTGSRPRAFLPSTPQYPSPTQPKACRCIRVCLPSASASCGGSAVSSQHSASAASAASSDAPSCTIAWVATALVASVSSSSRLSRAWLGLGLGCEASG